MLAGDFRRPTQPVDSRRGLTTSSILLAPELVHRGERPRPFMLKCIPAIQVRHRPIAGKTSAIGLLRFRVQFKSDETEIPRGQEFLDLRNGQAMLLKRTQEIAAFADAEKIVVPGDSGREVVPGLRDGGWHDLRAPRIVGEVNEPARGG